MYGQSFDVCVSDTAETEGVIILMKDGMQNWDLIPSSTEAPTVSMAMGNWVHLVLEERCRFPTRKIVPPIRKVCRF